MDSLYCFNYSLLSQGMADRIIGMRKALKENLEKLGSPLSWEHITNQVNPHRHLFQCYLCYRL
jgi:aspartate/tyrosine/aromatic aminotransferase